MDVLCVWFSSSSTLPLRRLSPVLTHACLCWVCLLPPTQDTSSKCPKPSYSTVCYTQKGLAYYSDWGTLRNTGGWGHHSRRTHTASQPASCTTQAA